MKNLAFYFLLYMRPIAGLILKITGGLGFVLGVLMVIGNFIGGFKLSAVFLAGFCFLFSFGAFILREKYTDVLIALQPEGKHYTFYD